MNDENGEIYHSTRSVPHHYGVYRCDLFLNKKDVTCTCREKISFNHILFYCHQLNILFRNSDLFPKNTTNMFPTDVLYNPQYFVPLTHLLLKSPIGPLLRIVYVCIFMLCM